MFRILLQEQFFSEIKKKSWNASSLSNAPVSFAIRNIYLLFSIIPYGDA